MKRWKPLPILTITLGLLLSACYSPTHVGDGEFSDMRLALDLETGHLHVSPHEKYVLCETRGTPNGTILVYNDDMTTWGSPNRAGSGFAISKTEALAVSLDENSVHFLRTPDLLELGKTPEPPEALFDRETRIVPLPSGDGFVFVTSKPGRPNIWVLDKDTREFTRRGRSAMTGPIRGVAVDDETGHLLLTGRANQLEVFDLTAMKSLDLWELPVTEVSWGLAARGGTAWVGTMAGRLLPLDIEKGEAVEPLPLGGPGETFVALSGTGRFLVAAVQDRAARRPPYATNLRVFFVDENRLMDVATAFLETRADMVDLEILEDREIVVLSTTWDLLAWEYSK